MISGPLCSSATTIVGTSINGIDSTEDAGSFGMDDELEVPADRQPVL